MGYYDDYSDESRREGKRQSKRGSYIWTSLISAVIGGMLVLLATPTLMANGLMPGSAMEDENGDGENETKIGSTETVSVDVESNIVDAVEKVRPAVVGVVNLTKNVDPWTQDVQTVQQGTGSGVIIEKIGDKARVVTNDHVVAGAEEIEVVMSDGEHVSAELLGSDEITDLAVLEIDASKVQAVAEFGDSSKLRAGEPAIAIGNPLGLELSQSVTTGVISATDRSIQVNESTSVHVLQTDAAINPGNSGGPLVNVAGQVIGINSLKIAQQGVEGLGFAIPSNDAKPIIKDLIENGRVIRPYMGIIHVDLEAISIHDRKRVLNLPDDVTKGVLVYRIERGGPAYEGGLRQNDVIVAVDGETIEKPAELQRYLYTKKDVGDAMSLTFYREGKKQTIEMTLGETPLDLTR
ncbi:MAG: trypsin-like peptidase domain-containing protein [Novibacillus thermophilus]|uniref:PDZ domain-containing protein n=1 Tax=Novibacillus thermophilus TaxID=1471761 RepID=A0A1U9KBA4_9BACL|nr:trypsin-like peptidase domain-containing protein [Novibacillus thermophilus]AQS57273.1 hypothetical protein B0W44_17540 [Novibacillus thermophilus]